MLSENMDAMAKNNLNFAKFISDQAKVMQNFKNRIVELESKKCSCSDLKKLH